MTITGILILASGCFLVALAVVPEVSRRVRAGVFYRQLPLFYGWLILGMTALGSLVATSIAGVALGGVQGFIIKETRWPRSSIGFAAAAGVCSSGFAAPFAGPLADRFGPRWLMPIGTIILGICLYALSGADTVWQFIVILVLARAVSQPLLIGVVPRTLAVNFFLRKRNVALALTGMYRPFGVAINIQIISIIAVANGWRAAFRYLGTLSLLLTIPMVLIVRRRPEDIGLLPDGARPGRDTLARPLQPPPAAAGGAAERGAATRSQPREATWTAREAFRTRAYWLIAGSAMLGTMANSAIGFNTVPYLVEDSQLSTTQAAGVLSLGTLLSLSNLGWGYLADRFTPRRCMIWAMIIATGSIAYLFTVKSAAPAYVFGVIWGISSSSSEALVSMVLAQYYGRGSYGTLSGTVRSFESGGLGVGQGTGGVIYDLFGNYRIMLVAAMMAHVLAATLIFFARRPSPDRPMSSPVPDEVELG